MKKTILLITIFLISSIVSFGQKDFSKLSGKAKSKAAKKEEKAAKKDDAYQLMMNEGHDLFSNKEYEKAISKYESASERRPINVYPKVKIADVQLAMINTIHDIDEREKTAAVVPKVEIPEVKEVIDSILEIDTPDIVANSIPDEAPEKVIPEKKIEETPKKITPPQKTGTSPKVDDLPPATSRKDIPKKTEIETKEDFAISLAAEYEDGVTEEVFQEGNKKITRRVVVKSGKGADYRKVQHNWGGVFYFKNNETITEHKWNIETVLDK